MIAKIISVDWESALLAYCLNTSSFIKVKLCDDNGEDYSWESVEANNIGRIELKGLAPDCSYSGEFECSEGTVKLELKTLPAPQGELIGSYAIIADPHISCKTENRKGRFFVESEMILRDVVGLCNSLKPDFILIPGDITNNGTEEEYALSVKILEDLKMPYIAAPGNHDFHHGESSIKCWEKYFAHTAGVHDTASGKIISLNTANKHFVHAESDYLHSLLNNDLSEPVIIISHFQLFDNEHICRGAKAKKIVRCIDDKQKQLLNLIRKKKLIIYAGHQNICSIQPVGKSFQINVPQPVQHPCGFIYVSRYKNGFYHKFIPISSEVLRQWSIISGEQAADLYDENQWESAYREGKDLYQTNFIINF